jgi:cyanophycinase
VTRAAVLIALAAAAAVLGGCAWIRSLPAPFGQGGATSGTAATEVAPAPPRPVGTLLLAGGGPTSGTAIAEAVRIGGGAAARVVVVPLASTQPEAGRGAVESWRKAGLPVVELLDLDDAAHAAQQIRAATFVWMTGGDQVRLVRELVDRGLADEVRRRFEAGAVVGGTSAGAAALSELMLAGEGDTDEMLQGRVETVGGLGLWRGVIVDEHFVARRRFNVLTAAVLDHPQFVGVGIDESTAVVVTGTTLRVLGEGNVVVLDARAAKVAATRPGDASGATGVAMQVLSAGMTYDLRR